jgi:serine/threonine-protein phosphatase CPPED1
MIRALVVAAACVTLSIAPQNPPPAPGAPFFFIQLSDPQFGMFTSDREFAQETINFEFAIATVNRLRPVFVVVTGDLVNKAGDAAQIAEYRRIAGKLAPGIALYNIAGNHDVENAPTPASLAAYRKTFGEDRYTFRSGNLLGIVLNSSLIHTPDSAPADADAQLAWLRGETAKAAASGARHVVVFQHHPWFLKAADEPDQYFNIPRVRRDPLLTLFREAGIKTLVSGHYHQNAVVADAGFDAITTGPVGKPQGSAKSGIRVFTVNDAAIAHRYYELGEIPAAIVAK